MIHLLAIALLPFSRWAGFDCPPADQIYPCECFSHPYNRVHCDDVINFATVRSSLEGKFAQTIPSLRLTNMHFFSVPARALGDLSVRRLDFSDSKIYRIEKDAFEFQGKDSMRSLVLANNRLEDIPTEALQLLNSLQSLSLAGNVLMRVSGRAFENLNELMFLVLSENRISQIDKNAFPKNLEWLIISRNFLTTFEGSLHGLEHLEVIFANDNRFMSISGEFDDLPNLKSLYLDRNDISDISDTFLNLTSVTRLSLSRNRIHDVGESLMNLSKLTYLNLSYNYITELHGKIFKKLKSLQTLDLSGNYLTTICPTIKPLKFLHELRLSNLGLKDVTLHCFRNMKSLRILDLSHNRLVNIDAISHHPLPALITLRLDHNQLSTLGEEMTYAKNLTELDISYNKFTSLNAGYFFHNKKLATLGMEGNPWNCTEQTALIVRDLEVRGVDMQGRPDCSTESDFTPVPFFFSKNIVDSS